MYSYYNTYTYAYLKDIRIVVDVCGDTVRPGVNIIPHSNQHPCPRERHLSHRPDELADLLQQRVGRHVAAALMDFIVNGALQANVDVIPKGSYEVAVEHIGCRAWKHFRKSSVRLTK